MELLANGFSVKILRRFFVMVCFHVSHGFRSISDAFRRDIGFCAPHDRIQHELAEVWVGPIPMEMRARETETSSAIFAFRGPCHVLDLSVSDCSTNGWIPRMWIVGTRE